MNHAHHAHVAGCTPQRWAPIPQPRSPWSSSHRWRSGALR